MNKVVKFPALLLKELAPIEKLFANPGNTLFVFSIFGVGATVPSSFFSFLKLQRNELFLLRNFPNFNEDIELIFPFPFTISLLFLLLSSVIGLFITTTLSQIKMPLSARWTKHILKQVAASFCWITLICLTLMRVITMKTKP